MNSWFQSIAVFCFNSKITKNNYSYMNNNKTSVTCVQRCNITTPHQGSKVSFLSHCDHVLFQGMHHKYKSPIIIFYRYKNKFMHGTFLNFCWNLQWIYYKCPYPILRKISSCYSCKSHLHNICKTKSILHGNSEIPLKISIYI